MSTTAFIGIGGLGGSGTRFLVELLREQGAVLPGPRNESEDLLNFTRLFKWTDLLDREREISWRWRVFKRLMRGQFLGPDYVKVHNLMLRNPFEPANKGDIRGEFMAKLAQKPVPRIFFKEPNLHVFAAQILKEDPGFTFIYLMRNGLEMAYNTNQQQLNNWGKEILTEEQWNLPQHEKAISFWHWANEQAYRLKTQFPERVHIVRYEDLVENTEITMRRLCSDLELEFLGTNTQAKSSKTVVQQSGLSDETLFKLERWGY